MSNDQGGTSGSRASRVSAAPAEPEPEPEPSAMDVGGGRVETNDDGLHDTFSNPSSSAGWAANSWEADCFADGGGAGPPQAPAAAHAEAGGIEQHAAAHPPIRIFAAQCAVGGVLGFIGFSLTLVAAADEACGIVAHPERGYELGTLTRWPSTISELNSDWQSARGRLFFGFMLATAALLYVSRMPDELDRLPFEKRGHDDGEAAKVYVCCLADCGPGCETAHVDLCSWLAKKLCGRCGVGPERASELRRSLVAESTPRRTDAMCCEGHPGNTIARSLTKARLVVAPLGVVFVALCPTNNYWTEDRPGSDVVKTVHLSAAALLFLGGTIVEVMRLYFLWCESRAAGIRLSGEPKDTSCRRFLREPQVRTAAPVLLLLFPISL